MTFIPDENAYAKAKGNAWFGGMNPQSHRAAAETEKLEELFVKDLWNKACSDMLNKCLPLDKPSQPKSKLILLLCN